MSSRTRRRKKIRSPSARREWIEICTRWVTAASISSPSARREWIEISSIWGSRFLRRVSLREEGVD